MTLGSSRQFSGVYYLMMEEILHQLIDSLPPFFTDL